MPLGKKPDVRRVGSSLIATFNKANPPLVWRFDLDRNHSFTFALQGQDHEWELGVTSVKGEFHPVARFPVREDAEEAFASISRILARNSGGAGGVLKTLGILLLLFVTAAGVTTLVTRWLHRPVEPDVSELQVPGADSAADTVPTSQNGVPLSADDVLKPPAP